MFAAVALTAERDEVLFSVAAHAAAVSQVVDLELRTPATMLTAPRIALQHLPVELSIHLRIKPNSPFFVECGQSVPPEIDAVGTETQI